MEVKNNCASRVKWIFTNTLHQDEKKPIRDMWGEVLFDLEDYQPSDFEIISLVEKMSSEIKLIDANAKKIGLPERLYSRYIDKAQQALNVSNLNAGWANYKKFVTDDVLLCFAFCAHLFDGNEVEIDSDELQAIHDSLQEMREELANNITDPMLADFIEKQITIISKSLAEYSVKGSSALNSGFSQGLAEIIENEETIKANIDSPPINKIKRSWGMFQAVTKKAAEANGAVDTWHKVLGRGAELIEYISSID